MKLNYVRGVKKQKSNVTIKGSFGGRESEETLYTIKRILRYVGTRNLNLLSGFLFINLLITWSRNSSCRLYTI